MWQKLADFIIRNRLFVLIALLLITVFMGYKASQVKMSYEFNNAIPTSSQKYKDYQKFKDQFGQDGTMVVVGFQHENIFENQFFSAFENWSNQVKSIDGVSNILSIADAVNIKKKAGTEKAALETYKIFENGVDSFAVATFLNLPFYKNLLYNPSSKSYLTAIYLEPELVNSPKRIDLVNEIEKISASFEKQIGVRLHYSGLPYIRTRFAEAVKKEMRFILIISLVFTSLILLIFFRSIMTVVYSMLVVIMGVIWSVAILVMCGYKITLLTALLPPLIVVIGLPNCIYFLNKYHSEYSETGEKMSAIRRMVERMGIVTLFTNLTTMIGFGVFYFTYSKILKEFGLVAGLSILSVFIISLFALPAIFSYLKEPKSRHTKYLDNKFIAKLLSRIEHWSFTHPKYMSSGALIILLISIGGILRLEQKGHIVDDLPKENRIYKDLKFFENQFTGIMPLEILIDAKKKNKITSLGSMSKIDQLVQQLTEIKEFGKPLSYIEMLKFAKQAYYDGDSLNYAVPNMYDVSFIAPYLKMKGGNNESEMGNLIKSFVDDDKKLARISINIADVGSKKLPELLDKVSKEADEIFNPKKYDVSFTGTSVVFLEGSRFIINSLRDSILLALGMIFICMIFLFKSWRTVLIALVVNMVPLAMTAGIMGWFNIPLKPSTVLVFSIALGIAIDVTIRFIVNYRQDLPRFNYNVGETVRHTIQETGISIMFTSFILAVGFVVFLFSQFDGTRFLGLLTSLTLLWAMIANLTLLPILLAWFDRPKKSISS
jgi:predicted RND superfamily exporter protein